MHSGSILILQRDREDEEEREERDKVKMRLTGLVEITLDMTGT